MNSQRRTERITAVLPVAAAGTTIVLWSSAFVAIRHVGHHVSPGALSLGRLVVASAALGVVLGWRAVRRPGQIQRPTRRDWPALLVCGLLWFGLYNVALNAAEQRVDAGTASMLVNVGPILVAVFAGLLLGEGFPRSLTMGLAIAFAGAMLIGGANSAGANAEVWGVLLCLVAALSYAIAMTAQKPLLGRLSALQVTWLACVIGMLSCLPFAPDLVADLRDAPLSITGWVLYLGAFPTAIAFTTWAYALARTSAGKLGATTYLVPPVTILLSWGLLNETPLALAIVGGAMCLAGVFVARRQPPPQPGRSDLSSGMSSRSASTPPGVSSSAGTPDEAGCANSSSKA